MITVRKTEKPDNAPKDDLPHTPVYNLRRLALALVREFDVLSVGYQR